ncbi:MAG: hypothetical protein J5845_08530 [Lachnospiraceae bacterium]|nr:hypothetical protein [Lachnospiraceae bacterium]
MKAEDLLKSIEKAEEDIVKRSEHESSSEELRKPPMKRILPVAAIVIAVLAVAGGVIAAKAKLSGKKGASGSGDDKGLSQYVLAEAVIPKFPVQPFLDDVSDSGYEAYVQASRAYEDEMWKIRGLIKTYGEKEAADPVNLFTVKSMQSLLADRNGENRVYSPLNVYLTFAMLAEMTGGNSRKQLFTVLGAEEIEDLRKRSDALWNAVLLDDITGKCVLSSSVWLDESSDDYKKAVLSCLAESYHASAFRGKMGSSAYNEAAQAWLNSRTGNLLKDAAGGVTFGSQTRIALLTTILFASKWYDEFSETNTYAEVFHAADGDIETPFMHETVGAAYYRGDKFVAVLKNFKAKTGAAMWFILPNEGYTVDDLLTDPEFQQLMNQGGAYEERKSARIHLSVPKFDIASSSDLTETMKKLGVTDVLDEIRSDFSPLFEKSDGYFVSEAMHSVRVKIDEEGVVAAAFTEIQIAGAMFVEDELYFTFDRPFLFAIRTADNIPLFLGVVEKP